MNLRKICTLIGVALMISSVVIFAIAMYIASTTSPPSGRPDLISEEDWENIYRFNVMEAFLPIINFCLWVGLILLLISAYSYHKEKRPGHLIIEYKWLSVAGLITLLIGIILFAMIPFGKIYFITFVGLILLLTGGMSALYGTLGYFNEKKKLKIRK